MISFGRIRLDPLGQRLHYGSAETPLSAKAAAILEFLSKRPNELVTHDELLDAVWHGVHVQPEVLKVYIAELRKALRDSADKPRYIETVHRRGYRFIWSSKESRGPQRRRDVSEPFIGRAREIARLLTLLRNAATGHRQMAFITGEAGIGKTALLSAFISRVERREGICAVQGRVAPARGESEPFSPLLDALGNLPPGNHRKTFMDALRASAPGWLLQFPNLIESGEIAHRGGELTGASSQRMIREFAEALELSCRDATLVLGLDDLQRADPVTLDLLEYVASLTRPAKLLIVGVADDGAGSESVRSVIVPLQARRYCEEIKLAEISLHGLREFLDVKYPPSEVGSVLAAPLHRLSGGVPLFFSSAVHHMEAQGWILKTDHGWVPCAESIRLQELVPPTLTGLVNLTLHQLPRRDREVLEAASIVGREFTPALVAYALDVPASTAEDVCNSIVRHGGWLQLAGFEHSPGGGSSPKFRFLHELYREVLYCGQPTAERVQRHRRVAIALEEAFPYPEKRPASELTERLQAGQGCLEGIRYLRAAAAMASRRWAGAEAAALLSEALNLASRLPRTVRTASELEILDELGAAYFACGDFDHSGRAWFEAASKAMKHGRVDFAVRAMSRLVFPVGWDNPIRLRSAADRVLAQADKIEDPVIRAEVTIRALAIREIAQTGSINDSEKSGEALRVICHEGDPARIASARILHAGFQTRRSAYHDVIADVEDSLPILLRHGPIDVMRAEWELAWALLHAGQWGRMQSVARAAVSHAQKSGNCRVEALFTTQLAWLHVEAGAYDSAQNLCRHAGELSGKPRHGVGVTMWHVIMAMTAIGLRDSDVALEQVARALATKPHTDHFWHPLAEISALQAHLITRNLPEVQRRARRLLQLSHNMSEKTWKAVALSGCAKAAADCDDYSLAHQCLQAAQQLVDGAALPLAKWRVEAIAAEISDRSGASKEAAQFRDRSRRSRQDLFNSLGTHDPLRRFAKLKS